MIRKAEREDSEILLGLIDALADYEELDRPTADAKARLCEDAWPTSENGRPRFTAWLASVEEDGHIKTVGYAVTFETYSTFLARPTLYLEDLFILPQYRRRSIGGEIMEHIVQAARETGCGRVEWVVLDWNTSAQAFYQKLGAAHQTEWQHYRLSLI